jgi:hypothetical protein
MNELKHYKPILVVLIIYVFVCIYRVNVIYIDKDGKKHPVRGKVGDNLMYLAHKNEVEMEGMYTVHDSRS